MAYCILYLLPSITLWTRILHGDLARFSKEYTSCIINLDSFTNGHIERYFGILKRNTEKPGMDELIQKLWSSRKGNIRLFLDGLTKGKVESKNKICREYRNLSYEM